MPLAPDVYRFRAIETQVLQTQVFRIACSCKCKSMICKSKKAGTRFQKEITAVGLQTRVYANLDSRSPEPPKPRFLQTQVVRIALSCNSCLCLYTQKDWNPHPNHKCQLWVCQPGLMRTRVCWALKSAEKIHCNRHVYDTT